LSLTEKKDTIEDVKAVQLLIDSKLPEDLRDPTRIYDAKSISNLMRDIAQKYPERYEDLSKTISDIGRNASYNQGETLTLSDLRPVIDKEAILQKMDAEVDQARKESVDDKDFEQHRLGIWGHYNDLIERMTQKAALEQGNNLAYSVVSGARGKPPQLKAMLSTPGLFEDYKGATVPLFVRHSYGQGLRPYEYLASTAGTRKTVISTKSATAKGGDLSKIASQAATPIVVTMKDCGVSNGVELDIDENSLRGRVLARDAGPIKAGTVLDNSVIQELRQAKVPSVIARSVMTCQAPEGVCARCSGQWAGKFPSIGSSVGITSAQSIGEPITQMALNSKHQGGMSSGKKEFSGFSVISNFTSSPEQFPDRAAVAEEDGQVTGVEEAPQGGHYVKVNDHSHYVLPGYDVIAKQGDRVEAGDQLSDGLVDPGDIVRLRGLGEGRNYYVNRLGKILADSGMPADRRNMEMMARAALNHVVIDDPEGLGDYLPDDIANYSRLSQKYTPPDSAIPTDARDAHGKYLHSPALHYTIGTRITPRIAEDLHRNGFSKILASDDEPGFRPEMTTLRTASHYSEDWLAAQHTSFIRKHLNEDATRGSDSNIRENVHFAPRLAVGHDFGNKIEATGKF
jgi:DNA-directed RNA polymerase subunit beta'